MKNAMQVLLDVGRIGATVLLAGVTGTQLYPAQQPPPQVRPPVRAPQAIPAPLILEKITREQFRAMPSSALVIYRGRTITKSDYMSLKMQEWAANRASLAANATDHSGPTLDKIESSQSTGAELAAKNSQMLLEFEKMQHDSQRLADSPQYAALAKEALDLRDRYKSASQEEKAKIKQRAADVYSQLVKMEKNGAAAQR